MKLKISHLHLKTQECKMDVNDKKTAVSLRMDQTRKNGKEQDKTRQKRAYRPSLKQISVYSRSSPFH
ncbi:Maturase [Trichinella spiralis]|uniref:Maturase n=1 Tax=Trichinella spiralis TaxID=6334 RepID=A0ABR3K285_TRISP